MLLLDLAAWRSRYMRPMAFWPCLTTGVAFIMIINVFVENHYTKNLSYICHILFGFICIGKCSKIYLTNTFFLSKVVYLLLKWVRDLVGVCITCIQFDPETLHRRDLITETRGFRNDCRIVACCDIRTVFDIDGRFQWTCA